MPTLEEILNDEQGFGNDLSIDLNGNKIPLGDIRKFRAGTKEAERIAVAKRTEAEKTAMDAATLLAQLQEASKTAVTPAKTAAVAAGTGYDWKSDPFFAPVVAEIASVLEVAKASQAAAEATRKQLEQTAAVYSYERLRAEYDRAPESFRSKIPFEQVAQEAIAAKEIDRFGLPTISRRVREATEPDRIAEATTAAVAKAKTEWEREAAAAAVGKPGAGGAARFSNRKDAAPPPNKRIEDITSDMVAADPDVQAALRGDAPLQ